MAGPARWALSAAVSFLFLVWAPAGALALQLSFTGLLTTVGDPLGLLPSAVAPGVRVTGTLSYAPKGPCLPVAAGTCEYIAAPATLGLLLAATPIASIDGHAYLFVEDGPLVDSVSASVAAPAGAAEGSAPVWMSGDLQLTDPGATALGGTELPTNLDLAGFAQHTFDAQGCYGGTCTGALQDQFQIAGTILSVQIVPEPGTGTLLTLGLLTLRGGRAKRRRGLRPPAH